MVFFFALTLCTFFLGNFLKWINNDGITTVKIAFLLRVRDHPVSVLSLGVLKRPTALSVLKRYISSTLKKVLDKKSEKNILLEKE